MGQKRSIEAGSREKASYAEAAMIFASVGRKERKNANERMQSDELPRGDNVDGINPGAHWPRSYSPLMRSVIRTRLKDERHNKNSTNTRHKIDV